MYRLLYTRASTFCSHICQQITTAVIIIKHVAANTTQSNAAFQRGLEANYWRDDCEIPIHVESAQIFGCRLLPVDNVQLEAIQRRWRYVACDLEL